MKLLDNLTWEPTWTSHMGCIKGCVEYLGINDSLGWIFGGTGHAFIINIGSDSCPSGPTAWKTPMIFNLARNLGYAIDGVWAHKSMPDFTEKRKQAWAYIKTAIDNGKPCYGWEMDVPEFQVIQGYDETGYYYMGSISRQREGPKPWDSVGESNIGIFELYSVDICEKQPLDITLRNMIDYIKKQVNGEFTLPNYFTGPEAFSVWAEGIINGSADRGGIAYNSRVWGECRSHAVGFLEEAKHVIGISGDLFDEVIKLYIEQAAVLAKVAERFPFNPSFYGKLNVRNENSVNVARLLRKAGELDEKALEILYGIQEII